MSSSTPTPFSIDEIIHPDAKVQAEQFECPVCLRIPPSPVQTECCNNIFCADCLGELFSCPNCRSPFELGKARSSPLPRLVQRMFHSLPVVCPHGSMKKEGGDRVQALNSISQGRFSEGGGASSSSSGVGSSSTRGKAPHPKAPLLGSSLDCEAGSDRSVGAAIGGADLAKGADSGEEQAKGEAGTAEPSVGNSSTCISASTTACVPSSTPAVGKMKEELFCSWTGTYDMLGKHLTECAFAPVECPKGCGMKTVRGKLVEHEAVCPKSVEVCKICGAGLRPGEKEEHR